MSVDFSERYDRWKCINRELDEDAKYEAAMEQELEDARAWAERFQCEYGSDDELIRMYWEWQIEELR